MGRQKMRSMQIDKNIVSLYLASQSPRRREILEQIGVNYSLLSVSVEELLLSNETPAQAVIRLAELKARAGVQKMSLEHATNLNVAVLGADTIVVVDNEILGKPRNQNHAAEMMHKLSGRTHQVMSAISIQNEHRVETVVAMTEVSFNPISEAEISDYWQSGEPIDKAGGYGIQGLGAAFVAKIAGSYSGVVGLPIEKLVPMLKEFDIPIWQKSSREM